MMRGILSNWWLAAVWQALQRGKGGSYGQEAICVNGVGGFFVVAKRVET
jgi:hypothetical protein